LAPTTAPPAPDTSTQIEYPANLIINRGPIVITISTHGEILNQTVVAGPIEIEITVEGSPAQGQYVGDSPIVINVSLHHTYAVVEAPNKCNWVKWSKIGSLNFTIDESNIAGERPLDWKGCVYKLLKLDKAVIAYGSNGVTVLTPSGISYGMQTIHRLGVVARTAIAGTDTEHYFIDTEDMLYKLSTEGLKKLDYSEYLTLMTNPVLSLDPETGLLYICDGEIGFVYSTKSDSFGSGPINVAGVGSQSGTLYLTAPDTIDIPKFDICTDIYDLGIRKPKTIHWIELGTDLTYKLQVMVESRISNKGSFIQSNWALVNPSGIAYIPCYGVEFKFHVRSYVYEYLELDYIKVTGSIHGFSYLDSLI